MVDFGKPGDKTDYGKSSHPEDIPLSSESRPSMKDNDDKLWVLMCHLSPVVGLGILVPLVIWLVKKDDSEFVEDQAREALNFHLSVYIVGIISVVTCIGPLIVAVAAVVFSIIAAVESNKGVAYRYPLTFRMIS